MKIKTQLLFAQLPTILIIGLITWFFMFSLNTLRDKAEVILVQNFKTISTVETLRKYLEEINNLYLDERTIGNDTSLKFNILKAKIEQQFLVLEGTIQNKERKELIQQVENSWKIFQSHIVPLSLPEKQKSYGDITDGLKAMMSSTLNSIAQTKENFSSFIESLIFFILIAATLSMILGVYLSWFFAGLFLSPLRTMTETMRQIGTE
jgi:hypothetical protein